MFEGTSNELKIPSLNKNYLLSIFTCQASNNNITNPLQTSITLDLNRKYKSDREGERESYCMKITQRNAPFFLSPTNSFSLTTNNKYNQYDNNS